MLLRSSSCPCPGSRRRWNQCIKVGSRSAIVSWLAASYVLLQGNDLKDFAHTPGKKYSFGVFSKSRKSLNIHVSSCSLGKINSCSTSLPSSRCLGNPESSSSNPGLCFHPLGARSSVPTPFAHAQRANNFRAGQMPDLLAGWYQLWCAKGGCNPR